MITFSSILDYRIKSEHIAHSTYCSAQESLYQQSRFPKNLKYFKYAQEYLNMSHYKSVMYSNGSEHL